MDVFHLCQAVVKKETEKFKFNTSPNFSEFKVDITEAIDLNYEAPAPRINYIYRFGFSEICFARLCFHAFLSRYTATQSLIDAWARCDDLSLCLVDRGPGLGYLPFLMAVQDYRLSHSISKYFALKTVHVFSSCGGWRNTHTLFHEVLRTAGFKGVKLHLPNQFKLFEDQLFIHKGYIKSHASNSQIVMLIRTLNLKHSEKLTEKGRVQLKTFFKWLRQDSVLFCIDTRSSIEAIISELPDGEFLYKPMFLKNSETIDASLLAADQCLPETKTEGCFLAWRNSKPGFTSGNAAVEIPVQASKKSTSSKSEAPKVKSAKSLQTDKIRVIKNDKYTQTENKKDKFTQIDTTNDIFKSTSHSKLLQTETESENGGNSAEIETLIGQIKGLVRTLNSLLPTTYGEDVKTDLEAVSDVQENGFISLDTFNDTKVDHGSRSLEVDSPKIVIPLDSLSSDAISQIVSIILTDKKT